MAEILSATSAGNPSNNSYSHLNSFFGLALQQPGQGQKPQVPPPSPEKKIPLASSFAGDSGNKTETADKTGSATIINPETAETGLNIRQKMAEGARFINNPFKEKRERDEKENEYAAMLNGLIRKIPVFQIPRFAKDIAGANKIIMDISTIIFQYAGKPSVPHVFDDPPDPLEAIQDEAREFQDRTRDLPLDNYSLEESRKEVKPLKDKIVHALENAGNYSQDQSNPDAIKGKLFYSYLYLLAYIHRVERLDEMEKSIVTEASPDRIRLPPMNVGYHTRINRLQNIQQGKFDN